MPITYALIGEKLGHSFSPQIHKALGGYDYQLCPLPPEKLADFLQNTPFQGLNVTIPYKQAVIPFCQQLTESARAIGSVNTLVRQADGSLLGDNTDLFGLLYLAQRAGVELAGKKVLILGTGGTSLTAQAAARSRGAGDIVVVSRQGPECYKGLAQRHPDAQVLINTTPVGMFPNAGALPVDPRQFPALEGVLDVIYNPLTTAFLQAAAQMPGVRHSGGLPMLVAQAWAAAGQFTGKDIPQAAIETIHGDLLAQLRNIVLVGMPGSGKSSIGELVAQALGRPFVDLDDLVIEQAGKTVPEIFAQEGEKAFRDYESAACIRVAARTGCVIATGGGTVLRPENTQALAQNSFLTWLQRDLSLLPTQGRPLSAAGPGALEALLRQREPLYRQAADFVVENKGTPQQAAQEIVEAFYEAARHQRP